MRPALPHPGRGPPRPAQPLRHLARRLPRQRRPRHALVLVRVRALGLYPEVPGVGVLAIGSPLFARAEIRLPHRRRDSAAPDPRGPRNARRSPSARRSPYVCSLRSTAAPTASPGRPTARSPAAPTLSFQLGAARTAAGAPPPPRRRRRSAPAARCRSAPAHRDADARRATAPSGSLAGLTALGVALRFASLGVQSYHHDEVITAMRVLPGSFGEMLHAVKVSESNPPLYYVLGWGWAKVFGTGEFGLRSLSALFGAATVPVGYLIGRQLAEPPRRPHPGGADRRQPDADLVLAGGPLLRAAGLLRRRWRCSSSSAPWTQAAGATSPAGRWPRRWRSAATTSPSSRSRSRRSGCWSRCARAGALVLPALGGRRRGRPGAAAAGQLADQPDPHRLDRKQPALPERLWETGVSFLVGETGHVIAEAPRERYALVPIVLVGVALLLVALRGEPPRAARRGARAGRWDWASSR